MIFLQYTRAMRKLKFKKLSIKQIFLLGLLIRLLVMPFFAHDDIFAEHRRAEKIVCQGKSPLSYSAYGLKTLESAFTLIFTPFITCDNLAQIQISNTEVDNLNRVLFFFKLPYLLFEVGYWWIMWEILKPKGNKIKKQAAVFLSLNPIIIYSIYMFGRYESYNLFLSAIAIYSLFLYETTTKHKKYILFSSLALSLLLIFRFSYLLIIPALIISFGIVSSGAVLAAATTTTGFLILKAIPFVANESQALVPDAAGLSSGIHQNYVYQSFINLGGHSLYLFIFIFALIFFWWLEKQSKLLKKPVYKNFALLSSIIFLAFFATTYFHPQYITWAMPFLLINIVNDKKGFLWKSFWWSIPFYFIYLLNWNIATTFGLAAPISEVFKAIEPENFIFVLDKQKWVNIARTFLTAAYLYWVYYLTKTYDQEN